MLLFFSNMVTLIYTLIALHLSYTVLVGGHASYATVPKAGLSASKLLQYKVVTGVSIIHCLAIRILKFLLQIISTTYFFQCIYYIYCIYGLRSFIQGNIVANDLLVASVTFMPCIKFKCLCFNCLKSFGFPSLDLEILLFHSVNVIFPLLIF